MGDGMGTQQRAKQAQQAKQRELPLQQGNGYGGGLAMLHPGSDWAWDWRCSPRLIIAPWRSSPRNILYMCMSTVVWDG